MKPAKKIIVTPKKRKNSRNKGANGEREFAKYLTDRGYPARRGQQFHGGPGSPDVVSGLPVHIEVKRVEGTKMLSSWMAQAVRDSGGKMPVVAHRRNGDGWLVVLRLDDFLTFMPRPEFLQTVEAVRPLVDVDPDADLLG